MGCCFRPMGPTGTAEPAEELAASVWVTGAGARSLCARWLDLSDADAGPLKGR
jgi:hypothetical protein